MDLSKNRVGDAGAIALFEALRLHANTVSTVDLSLNGISSVAGHELANLLRANSPSVTSLFFRNNFIADEYDNHFTCP